MASLSKHYFSKMLQLVTKLVEEIVQVTIVECSDSLCKHTAMKVVVKKNSCNFIGGVLNQY